MNRVNMRRRDRELIMPPIWHTGEIYKCVKFARKFILKHRETVEIYADGEYNIELDTPGNYLHDTGHALVLEKGEHSLTITVYNEKALPCLCPEKVLFPIRIGIVPLLTVDGWLRVKAVFIFTRLCRTISS